MDVSYFARPVTFYASAVGRFNRRHSSTSPLRAAELDPAFPLRVKGQPLRTGDKGSRGRLPYPAWALLYIPARCPQRETLGLVSFLLCFHEKGQDSVFSSRLNSVEAF
jgi:hypothetical protein